MEYSITELARISGVSTRTLRHYDAIGLLHPSRVSEAGYRFYGTAEADTLQQILFYRERGVSLEKIGAWLGAADFDRAAAMEEHLAVLREKRAAMDRLIENAEKTLRTLRGEETMLDTEKFEAFKQDLVRENEERYGAEVREKYGDAQTDAFGAHIRGMSREAWMRSKQLEEDILRLLEETAPSGDPAGEEARRICAMHREWLTLISGRYSREYHRGLAEMYVADPRFTAYYDRNVPGCAAFLRDAIAVFCGA